MALYTRIEKAHRQRWSAHYFERDQYIRRLAHSDQNLVIVLSNKIRHHTHDQDTWLAKLIHSISKLLQPFRSKHAKNPNQMPNRPDRIILTGLELQHLHRLCEFETPEEIHLQEDYLMEPQILEALLSKARMGITQ